jgi:hypothetical protein
MTGSMNGKTLSAVEAPGAIDLLDRVGAFRSEAFDLLEALTRRSTETWGNSALPEATAEMQHLVNILGDVERLLSRQPRRTARPRLTQAEGR